MSQAALHHFIDTVADLLGNRRYGMFTGAKKTEINVVRDILCDGVQTSETWQKDVGLRTKAVRVFMPSDPSQDDGVVMLSMGWESTWAVMHALGLLSE